MTVDSHKRLPGASALLRSRIAVLVAALIVIWGIMPLLPYGSGLQFSWVYRIFFTVVTLFALGFYWLFDRRAIAMPKSPAAALSAVAGATVVAMVAAGVVYPTYPVPKAPVKVSGEVAHGKQVFFNPSFACYRCHKIDGKGGVRGPDLSHIAAVAGSRVSGLSAEQFLTEKIQAGATYKYKTPKYSPSMPPYKALLNATELKDLVAYLLSLT